MEDGHFNNNFSLPYLLMSPSFLMGSYTSEWPHKDIHAYYATIMEEGNNTLRDMHTLSPLWEGNNFSSFLMAYTDLRIYMLC